MTDELPNWSDALQAIVSLIGIPLTIYTLYKLVKKDKERESEIASLSLIASQLKNMLAINQIEHVENRVPHLQIDFKSSPDFFGMHVIKFVNINSNCRITSYKRVDKRGFKNVMATDVADSGGKQEFEFVIKIKDDESFNIEMIYTVNDKYIYNQELRIYKYREIFNVRPGKMELIDVL